MPYYLNSNAFLDRKVTVLLDEWWRLRCDRKRSRPLRLWPVRLTFLFFFFFLCVLSDNSFRLWVWVRCVKWLLWRVRWSRGVLCCFRRNLLLSIWKRRADYVVVDCIAFAMMFRRCRFTHQLYDWNKCLLHACFFFSSLGLFSLWAIV